MAVETPAERGPAWAPAAPDVGDTGHPCAVLGVSDPDAWRYDPDFSAIQEALIKDAGGDEPRALMEMLSRYLCLRRGQYEIEEGLFYHELEEFRAYTTIDAYRAMTSSTANEAINDASGSLGGV